ncbi:hypothetical protein Pfo_018327 [Paulownia fortunei]|nr:hypothetical protein Pfo_018327 [Paulownia fortunei]
MKALSSFSSPSSCNAHETLSSSRNGRTAGCISRILRRILCFSSLPSCPFDRLKEEVKDSSMAGATGTPGIVARLMGLESLPLIEPIEGSPLMSCADSFKKSRSPQVRRRWIIPTYQELEDDNFFILSFEQEGDGHESHIERRKSGKNSGRMQQSMGEKCKKKSMRRRESLQERNKENQGENIVSKGNLLDGVVIQKDSNSGIGNNSDFQVENPSNVLRPLKNSCQKPEKIRKKKAKGDSLAAINCETEGDSENSSPISVLEFVEFPTDQETACSGDISRLASSKMRRTLSEELENCGKSKEKRLINSGFDEREKHSRLRNRHQNYAGKWDEIGELAAKEMIKSSWVHDEISKNQHHFKEIGRDLASKILDQLMDELLINH